MTTYKTYQEAKIAMPKACIIENTDSGLFFGMPTREGATLAGGSRFAEPQYYCMTVEKFLEDGHKFVEGDIYLTPYGRVITAGSPVISTEHLNKYGNELDDCFILRAAALDVMAQDNEAEETKAVAELPRVINITNCKSLTIRRGLNVTVNGYRVSVGMNDEPEKPQPRTRTTYEKVSPNKDGGKYWEVARDWSEGYYEFFYNTNPSDKDNGVYKPFRDEHKALLNRYMNKNLYRKVERPIEWWEGAADYINTIDGEDNAEVEMLGKGLNKEHAQTAATLMLDVSHALEIIENEHGHEVVGKVAKLLEQEGE